jgi:hypothetical protein
MVVAKRRSGGGIFRRLRKVNMMVKVEGTHCYHEIYGCGPRGMPVLHQRPMIGFVTNLVEFQQVGSQEIG